MTADSDGGAPADEGTSGDEESPSEEDTPGEEGARGDESSADHGEDEPTVGDGRPKHVVVLLADGTRREHGDVRLEHSSREFVVDPEDPEAEPIRYDKSELARVEITQHHSACFITTAVAGESRTLDALRGFRDDALAPAPGGPALLAVYETISPPIARTLARHPDARLTRAVRRLVEGCAHLARRRARCRSDATRATLSVALVALYLVGLIWAAAGHVALAGFRATRNRTRD